MGVIEGGPVVGVGVGGGGNNVVGVSVGGKVVPSQCAGVVPHHPCWHFLFVCLLLLLMLLFFCPCYM